MKAVILTRVSTKMQEERLSLRAQNKRLEEYAERKELDAIKRFEIIESSTRGERKRFMEMINFYKKQKETIAIVADTVDRVQRSFKESVLLDELMRQDKIELHFYREGMILNSKSTSADIMRWDFSVMGAKAYVLQLSENVRRSTELKTKNGERCGVAPLGYENYVDERGKHNIRLKEPEAGIIKQIFELYALGKMSILEAVRRGAEIQPKAFCAERLNHLRKNEKGLSLRRPTEKKILFVGGLLHQNRAESIHPGTKCFKCDRNRPKPYQNTGFLNKSAL